jgi:hypothetical protein
MAIVPMFSRLAVFGTEVEARPSKGTVRVVLTMRKVDGVAAVSFVKPVDVLASMFYLILWCMGEAQELTTQGI